MLLLLVALSRSHAEEAPLFVTSSARFNFNTEFDNPQWTAATIKMAEDYLSFIEKETGLKWPKGEKIEANIYCTDARYVSDDKARSGGRYASVWAYNLGKTVNVLLKPRFDETYLRIVGRSPVGDPLLLHEILHALDMNNKPVDSYFPTWLCEGRAEYFSRLYREVKGVKFEDDIWYSRHYASLREDIKKTGKLPFDFKKTLEGGAETSYRVAFSLYGYLKNSKHKGAVTELERLTIGSVCTDRRFRSNEHLARLLKAESAICKEYMKMLEDSPDQWIEHSLSAWGEGGKLRMASFPGLTCVLTNRKTGKPGALKVSFKLHIHPVLTRQVGFVYSHKSTTDYRQISIRDGREIQANDFVDGWKSGQTIRFEGAGVKWNEDGINELAVAVHRDRLEVEINGTSLTLAPITELDETELRWGFSAWDSYAEFWDIKMGE